MACQVGPAKVIGIDVEDVRALCGEAGTGKDQGEEDAQTIHRDIGLSFYRFASLAKKGIGIGLAKGARAGLLSLEMGRELQKIAVLGPGLLGGSVGWAVHKRGLGEVRFWGRSSEKIEMVRRGWFQRKRGFGGSCRGRGPRDSGNPD